MADEKEQPDGSASTVRGVGSAVTNAIKVGGLIVGVYEALFRSTDPHFSVVLAFSALAITGGQGLGTFFDKFLGK